MRKTFSIPLAIVVVAVAFVGVSRFAANNTAFEGASDTDSKTGAALPASSTDVVIDVPLPGETVQSPLTVSGKARGNWFFEANIPVVLKDENGNIIAEAGGYAEGDWMTTDFVPFSATLTFTDPGTAYGTLEIRKDNPSGDANRDASHFVPVAFDRAARQVWVYWGNTRLDKDAKSCTNVFPRQRTVLTTTTIARAVLDQLLAGPDADEKRAGYLTSIPERVAVRRLWIQDGVAHVDFNSALNAGGSCRVAAIRSQVEHTLEQFPSVTSVVISVDGNVEEALQP